MPVRGSGRVSNDLHICAMTTRNLRTASSAAKNVADTARRTSGRSSKRQKKSTLSETLDEELNTPWYNFFTKSDPMYNKYMSTEWGFEKRENEGLFENLSLEGAQAGLSWHTILKKRQAYRRTFCGFDVKKVADMTDSDVEHILASQGSGEDIIVRHAGKIRSVINNAECIIKMGPELEERGMNFGDYIWSFVDNKPILNRWGSSSAPSKTEESEAMSKDLKKRGFRFVGPTTCYSLMQSCGLVIDHLADSPEWLAAKERLENRTGGYQKRFQGSPSS